MNNHRRARLSVCAAKLENLKVLAEATKESLERLNNLKAELDSWSVMVTREESVITSVESEEQAALDSIPDNFQMNDIAYGIEDALYEIGLAKDGITALKDSIDKIEDTYITSFLSSYEPDNLIDELENYIEAIDEAKEHIEDAKA